MLTVIAAFLVLALLVAAVLYAGRLGIARERAAKADGSFGRQFVWVDDDGSARELNAEELGHLNTDFQPGDIGQPHIKGSYATRTRGEPASGFLLRSRLPQDVSVRS